jgi:hypothetical protein
MSFQEHQPSPEELKIAESMMNDTEKMESAAREKGYYDVIKEEAEKRGREAARARIEQQKEMSSGGSFHEEKNIKGFDIVVDCDNNGDSCTITFPKLKGDAAAYDKNILSPSITLTGLQKGEANKVFTFAFEQANIAPDIYALYSEVSIFANNLIRKAS